MFSTINGVLFGALGWVGVGVVVLIVVVLIVVVVEPIARGEKRMWM